jgi:CDP-glycerol glycerophosphotransferase
MVLSPLRSRAVATAFTWFDRVLPVRDDFWCFACWDRHSHTLDNPRAVFEAVKDDPSIRKIVLQKDVSAPPVREGRNVRFVTADSLLGAWYLARSRVLLLGTALRAVCEFSQELDGERHLIVQLWHGIPLKRIAMLFPGDVTWPAETRRYAATVCSSERDRDIMERAFAPIPRERVWLSGLPRNDFILMDAAELPADYRAHVHELERALAGRRLVLYAPTWRKDEEALYVFSPDEERELERLMREHGAVLGIRGHSNVRHADVYTRERDAPSIISLNDVPDVNVVLRSTDVLITDYSSIYIDFVILDRPVVHFAYDIEDYVAERGFLYDLDEAFAGPCVTSFADLMVELGHALAEPARHGALRERARRLFHEHGERPARDVLDRTRELVRSSSPTHP